MSPENFVHRREVNRHIIFDSTVVADVTESQFDPQYYRDSDAYEGTAMGRGTTHMVQLAGKSCVLRHYRRGGAVVALMDDKYCWLGLKQTRAWQEWHMLKTLADENFPVPKPVAAQITKTGWYYRADLITQKIENSESIAQILQKENLPDSTWAQIGQTLRRFHKRGVYHADLNAHNILLDQDRQVYVIDFDRGRFKPPSINTTRWQQSNMGRLLRSLKKLQELHEVFNFDNDQWQVMQRAYVSE